MAIEYLTTINKNTQFRIETNKGQEKFYIINRDKEKVNANDFKDLTIEEIKDYTLYLRQQIDWAWELISCYVHAKGYTNEKA